MAQPGFQTTFIPKREDARKKSTGAGAGIFTAIGVVILLGTVVVAVGFFLYARSIEASIEQKRTSLERSQGKFEPGLIELLADLDLRLMRSTEILDAHVAPSKIFRLVEESTLRSVQFTNFQMSYDPQFESVRIGMNGVGRNYAAVALQSDEFQERAEFMNPVFGGLRLDEKTGNILFDVEIDIDASVIDYVGELSPTSEFVTGTSGENPEDAIIDSVEATLPTEPVEPTEPAAPAEPITPPVLVETPETIPDPDDEGLEI